MKKYSKFLSLILRHKPEVANLTLDKNGWVETSKVVAALRSHFGKFSHRELEALVQDNDKQRFIITGSRIRANQGHSVAVDLELEPMIPPPILYHGTKNDFLSAIMREGLKPGSRQHVHLSPDLETANRVADRRGGKSVILLVHTERSILPFYQSANRVWLTDHVATECLDILRD